MPKPDYNIAARISAESKNSLLGIEIRTAILPQITDAAISGKRFIRNGTHVAPTVGCGFCQLTSG